MTEIKPGAELDQTMGKILGFDCRIEHHTGSPKCFRWGIPPGMRGEKWSRWNPGEDANHATEAAEKFGLLREHFLKESVLHKRHTYDVVHYGRDIELCHEETLPLAICAAICKLIDG